MNRWLSSPRNTNRTASCPSQVSLWYWRSNAKYKVAKIKWIHFLKIHLSILSHNYPQITSNISNLETKYFILYYPSLLLPGTMFNIIFKYPPSQVFLLTWLSPPPPQPYFLNFLLWLWNLNNSNNKNSESINLRCFNHPMSQGILMNKMSRFSFGIKSEHW